jgi:homoserine dehydrogenase
MAVMANSIGITVLGCGVVGGGVVNILTEQRELLRSRTGLTFDVLHIVDKNPDVAKRFPSIAFTTDASAAIADPKVQIVVELIGGTGVAGKFVEQALTAGKHVVTANKSLLATRGSEFFSLARKHDASIGFEASCGGGIPIINAILHGLSANRNDAIVGILNGTCNFILSQMTRHGWSYAQALAEAQKAGFAEADPTLDVSGRDTAQKLAILGGLAFNARIAESDIHLEGIDTLQDTDIKLAGELGYVGERVKDKLSLRVHPTLVHHDDVLADVSGSFNAVSLYGHAVGHTLYYGRGAGSMPAASAVVADIVNVGLGVIPLAFKQLQVFPDTAAKAAVLPFEELQSRYYLRLTAKDVPGVLADVTAALGKNGISLSAVLQRESNESKTVPVVITTHLAREGSVRKALAEIDALPTVTPKTVCLRIIDQPKEFSNGG